MQTNKRLEFEKGIIIMIIIIRRRSRRIEEKRMN